MEHCFRRVRDTGFVETTYNAVFKGGGAKGLAYAGALGACEVAGIRFSRVAGSSAGAITAALVASGHSATEIAALAPVALSTIDKPTSALLRPRSGSLLSTAKLSAWFDDTLGTAVHGSKPPPDASRVTFAVLYAKFEIELFVVAMDLGSRQPIVFSSELTPDASVTDAVLASSAIPVAFPAVRFVIDDEIHRVVDGGTWANYPAFVFLDDDFRAHHGLGQRDGTTIGFILDDGRKARDPSLNEAIRSADGPRFETDEGSALAEFGWLGAMLSSPGLRLAISVAPGLLLAIATLLLIREGRDGFPILERLPVTSHNWIIGFVAIVLVLLTPLWCISTLVIARLGRSVVDEGLVGAIAAMGVGPSVPYWIRIRRDSLDHVPIRIAVPSELTTLAFGASAQLVHEAMHAGYVATMGALNTVGLRRPPSSLPAPMASAVARSAVDVPGQDSWWRSVSTPIRWLFAQSARPVAWLLHARFGIERKATLRSFRSFTAVIAIVLLAAIVLGLAMSQAVAGSVVVGLILLAVAGIVPLYLVWFLARRKAMVVNDPFPVLGKLPTWMIVLTAVVSALIVGGLFAPTISEAPPVSRLILAEPQIGVIADVLEESSEVAVLVPRSLAELDLMMGVFAGTVTATERQSFSDAEVSGQAFTVPVQDADFVELRSCRGRFAPDAVGCWIFADSSNEVRQVGSRLDPSIDDSGLAFINSVQENVVISFGVLGILAGYAGLFAAIAIRCWDVHTWKRSQQSL